MPKSAKGKTRGDARPGQSGLKARVTLGTKGQPHPTEQVQVSGSVTQAVIRMALRDSLKPRSIEIRLDWADALQLAALLATGGAKNCGIGRGMKSS
jgi:hypothetical protein